MAKRWLIGTILMLGLLPSASLAQLFNFGARPEANGDNAFMFDKPLPVPEFAPDTSRGQPAGPEFAGDRPIVPFGGVPEEDRNGFLDDRIVEPDSSPLLFWVRGEYLNWQFRNPRLASIVATTSSTPNIVDNFGALDQAGTQVLLPAGQYSYDRFNGGRVIGGVTIGIPIEISGFWMNQTTTVFQRSSDGSVGSQMLSVPFQAPNLNTPGLQNVNIPVELASSAGFPGLTSGSLSVTATAILWGLDVNFYYPLLGADRFFFDCFAGYRHLGLGETLTIRKTLASVNPIVAIDFAAEPTGFGPGFTTTTVDEFATSNHYNAGQLGARGGFSMGRFAVLLESKLGLGETLQVLSVNGSSTLQAPGIRGTTRTLEGGIFAVNSNIGTQSRSVFSFVPEIDVNIGFQLLRSVRLFAGYSILWWTNVVRPGDQISNIVDSRQIPTNSEFVAGFTGTSPGRSFVTTDFWAQGFNFGILIGF